MNATTLDIPGLVLLQKRIFRDERGHFQEYFREEFLNELNVPSGFVQDNHSRSIPGVLRGLHFQRQPAQGKLVGVIRGAIWDVAVDLRAGSATFGRWYGTELSDINGRMLWIPAGFAHGFCVLGNEPADVLYKVDAKYNPRGEFGLHWADPTLNIAWPIQSPILSERDRRLPQLAEVDMSDWWDWPTVRAA